jgi:dsRNA-specific ribonuclease
MDISKVIKVVSGMLDVKVYFSADAAPIQSYKNALQEWCADKKHRLPAPIYKTVSESGPDHNKIYERAVVIGDRLVATGKGKNQKLADTAAAEEALEILKSESTKSIEISLDAPVALKGMAIKNKQPSPEFRDLGETEKSTPTCREYAIECRCMGQSATATAISKQQARALAAEKVIKLLSPKKEITPKKRVYKRKNKA